MRHTLLTAALLLPCLAQAQAQAPAQTQAHPPQLIMGLDNKLFFEAEGPRNGAPGTDAVAVISLADPAHPRITATLPLDNSVAGPPTNLQVTPDGHLALVASSLVNQPKEGGFTAVPDDRLHVIDLRADPPRLIETIKVGRMPSGLSIRHAGDLALVANRAGKSVSVLAINGAEVRQVAEVPVEDEVAAVVFSPTGAGPGSPRTPSTRWVCCMWTARP